MRQLVDNIRRVDGPARSTFLCSFDRARTFGRGTVRRGTVRRKKKMLVSARLG